ncbi:MAG: serine/threonine protein kinase [Deltaproteobacteria bacterium]|nr:serine/threonine protein kinase [Deltaproteobacteria bacterium]
MSGSHEAAVKTDTFWGQLQPARTGAPSVGPERRPPPWLGGYRLLRRIGVGGMAEVFLARRVAPSPRAKLIALKRILPELSKHPGAQLMFSREADILTRLRHPNIVQVDDVAAAAQGYYTMALIDGPRIPDLVRGAQASGQRLPFEHVVELVGQAACGLHHAHECRDHAGRPFDVVHCDVSPANLMIDRAGRLKLLDFGIAQTRDHRVDPRDIPRAGTLAYMSPEQRRGHRVDRRSDVFSLGIVLWELAVWRRAPRAKPRPGTAGLEPPLPAPRTVDPRLPPRLDAILVRALSPDPVRRFGSAAEFGAALSELRRSTTVRPEHSLGAWVRRHTTPPSA